MDASTEDLPTVPPDAPEPNWSSMSNSLAPPSISGYEILGELGRGGMGVVYKARHLTLGRIVALKMILSGNQASDSDRARFIAEAQAVAQLHHTNIVQLFEVGESDGRPFFALEYVDGGSLADRVREHPLPSRDAARIMAAIAQGVEYAHSHGFIHRDLKPENVLIGEGDVPKITDFGLVKKKEAKGASLTQSGAIVGTPSYMAPEQAAGCKSDIGPATDVYALGGILYRLLTGRPPFHAATPLDTLLQVLEKDPAPPRLLNPGIDRDLETICLKCLEKDPARRYASAREFADELGRFLAGDSIQARSFSLLDRVGRTLARSTYTAEFANWGNLLLFSGVTLFFCHTGTFLAGYSKFPLYSRWAFGGLQLVLIAAAFFRFRPRQLLPSTPAERQLWSIWIGYWLCFGTVTALQVVTHRSLSYDANALYPYSAILSGFAFFCMGCSYWGGLYAVGVGFMLLSVVMPVNPRLAPLEFGLAWSSTLMLLGFRLRRMSQTALSEAP